MEALEHPSPLVELVNILFAPLGIHVPNYLVFCALIVLIVLVIAVGGLVDTVVDGMTGIHVPPRSPERIAESLRSADPRRASRLYGDIASLSEARGRWDEAEQFLRRAVAIAPNSSEAAEAGWRRGWVAWRSGKRTLARQLWFNAGSAHSGHGSAAASLFWAARLTPENPPCPMVCAKNL